MLLKKPEITFVLLSCFDVDRRNSAVSPLRSVQPTGTGNDRRRRLRESRSISGFDIERKITYRSVDTSESIENSAIDLQFNTSIVEIVLYKKINVRLSLKSS